MNPNTTHMAMAGAFREATLGLIGLFQIFDVVPDLSKATADVLGQVFRKHIRAARINADDECLSPLHILADELERAAKPTLRSRRRRRQRCP